jgi:hypothetical protein
MPRAFAASLARNARGWNGFIEAAFSMAKGNSPDHFIHLGRLWAREFAPLVDIRPRAMEGPRLLKYEQHQLHGSLRGRSFLATCHLFPYGAECTRVYLSRPVNICGHSLGPLRLCASCRIGKLLQADVCEDTSFGGGNRGASEWL